MLLFLFKKYVGKSNNNSNCLDFWIKMIGFSLDFWIKMAGFSLDFWMKMAVFSLDFWIKLTINSLDFWINIVSLRCKSIKYAK